MRPSERPRAPGLLALVVAAWLLGGCTEGEGGSATVVAVQDGDSLVVRLASGREERVRLIGIDAPERGQGVWAERARGFARRQAGGRTVRLELDLETHDRYGRLLAYVWIEDRLLNEELLRAGLARLYTIPPNVRHVDRFVLAQREARRARTGIWSPEGGLREHPAEFRRRQQG